MKIIKLVPNPDWEKAEYEIVDRMLDGRTIVHSMRARINGQGLWEFIPKYIFKQFDDEDKALED